MHPYTPLIWFRRMFPVCCAVVLSFVLDGQSAAAESAAKRTFNVPAGEAEASLKLFSEQSGQGVIFPTEKLKGVRTNEVRGEFTAGDAIELLTQGTPLVVTRDVKTGAYAVRHETKVEAKNVSRASAESGRPERSDGEETSDTETVVKLDTFEVMGSKLLNMDKPRSRDDAQPYVVFDRKQLEKGSVMTLNEFLTRNLTSTSINSFPADQTGSTNGNVSQINLGGLGTNQTLILVDGRRLPSLVSSGNPSQPDINGIPLASIERIEVLRSSAAGIYGGNATGGVVNIILRRDYVGVEATVTYGGTFEGGGSRHRVDLSGGASTADGKTNLLVSAAYADSEALSVGDRDLVQRGRARLLANTPGTFANLLGATTNISSTNGSVLTLLPAYGGGSIGSNKTFVPYGYAGPGSDNGAGLIANAGRYNLDLPDLAQNGGGRRQTLQIQPRMKSVLGTLRHAFTPKLNVFLEGSYSTNVLDQSAGVPLTNYTLTAGAPGNPFAQPIRIYVPATASSEFPLQVTTNASRIAGGVIAKLPRDWMAEVDFTWGLTSIRVGERDFFDSVAAGAAVTSGAVNPFRDAVVDLSFARYRNLQPESVNRVTLGDLTARLGGPLPFELPAGAPVFSSSFEQKREAFSQIETRTFGSPTSASVGYRPGRSQTTSSAYAELLFPFIASSQRVTAIDTLELQVAGRFDHYETIGSNVFSSTAPTLPVTTLKSRFETTNPTVALRYKPNRTVTLRGSYATGFLPPTINQLVPNAFKTNLLLLTATILGVTDPFRGNEVVGTSAGSTPITTGGSPDLKPERSKSWTAGIVFEPARLKGLRLAVDWTRTQKTDAITSLPYNSLLVPTLVAANPARVTRGPVPVGSPFSVGPITALDNTVLNLSQATLEAYDVSLDYNWTAENLGSFEFSAHLTDTVHSLARVTPSAIESESRGILNSVNGILRYRATGSLTWNWRQWSVNWFSRYYDSYYLTADRSFVAAQGSATVPPQWVHDLNFTYRMARTDFSRLPRWLRDGAVVNFGVTNVLNERPAFDATSVNQMYYSVIGDPRQAAFYVSVKLSFK